MCRVGEGRMDNFVSDCIVVALNVALLSVGSSGCIAKQRNTTVDGTDTQHSTNQRYT